MRWRSIFTRNKSKVHGDGRLAVVRAIRGIRADVVPEYEQHAVENVAPLTTGTILPYDEISTTLSHARWGHGMGDVDTIVMYTGGVPALYDCAHRPYFSVRLASVATSGFENDELAQGLTASPHAAPFVSFDVRNKSNELLDLFEKLRSGGVVVTTRQGVVTGSKAVREFQNKRAMLELVL